MSKSTSIYIHFPWCIRKCPYCDFASYRTAREDIPQRAYTDAVIHEFELRLPSVQGRALQSVFFGGGTPSLWQSSEMARLLERICQTFCVRSDEVEVTVECNPSSLDAEVAKGLCDAGVNRLSVGVQSLDDTQLHFLGRSHSAQKAMGVLKEVVPIIPRVNADFIFALPDQSPESFVAQLQRPIDAGVEHISAYALTIEPATQFGELHRKGRLPIAVEDDVATTFMLTHDALAFQGFSHYEVSNYSLVNAEAKHNQHYWRGGDYLGMGAGAVGKIDARRYRNHSLPDIYMHAQDIDSFEESEENLSTQDLIREAFMLGLRTHEGINLSSLKAHTQSDIIQGRERVLERRLETGDLILQDNVLRVPYERWLFLDAIVADLF